MWQQGGNQETPSPEVLSIYFANVRLFPSVTTTTTTTFIYLHLQSQSIATSKAFPGNSPVPRPTPAITEIFLKLCAAAINSAVPIKVLPIPQRSLGEHVDPYTPDNYHGYPKRWFGKGGSGFKYGHFWYLCSISEGGYVDVWLNPSYSHWKCWEL